ncbi:TPA: hypothetical protein N0F65_012534 [Lagenidium giganteum]|uniref:Uncharacterized protein n=1 Tax=Lagenidium giganteum TaxID=4803 RepID=A0AAV2YL78_9STRA|nr:TPA: hypothetical protein N0F65_012534 [Lagenidium giganteum]
MNVDAVHSNFVALCDEPACLFPSRPQPENLVGHTSSVCAVLAHDDRYLVSCSIDGSVKVWSRINFMCLHTLFGHDDTVSCVDLNTKWLVSGSHDKTLRLYSCLHSFKLLHICSGHTGHVTRVHLPSSLSSHILSCSDDTTMRLWNGDTGVCLAVLRGHTSRITSFLFFHGSRLCSGSAEGSICFWDVASDNQHEPHQQYRAIKSFRPHKSTIQCLASSASDDESWIFSASSDGSVQIFHAKTMEHCGCFDQLQSPIYTMLALSSGKLLCSTGDGRVVIYSDLPHGMHQSAAFSMTAFAKWISSVQLRGDLLACSSEDLLYVVDLDKCHVLVVIETRHGFVNSLSWLQATRLLTAGQDNVIKIWNT